MDRLKLLEHPFYFFVVNQIVKTYNVPRLMDKTSYLGNWFSGNSRKLQHHFSTILGNAKGACSMKLLRKVKDVGYCLGYPSYRKMLH